VTPDERRQAEQTIERAYLTIAAACRVLCVSKSTMRKWIEADLVIITEIGPPGHGVRKIARAEVERLRGASTSAPPA